MLGSMFGGDHRRGPERADPWEELTRVSAQATRDARRTIARAAEEVAPGLGVSRSEVLLEGRQAETAFEKVLSGLEDVLEELCSRYDYRQLLFVSRLCAGLPVLRSEEPNLGFTRMRVQSADRWVLRCGDRSLERDYMRIEEGGYSLGRLSDSLYYDAVKLHVLANFHRRVVTQLTAFNFMRRVSSENGLPGPKLRFNADGRVGWNFGSAELQAAWYLYGHRNDNYKGTLASWGLDEFPTEGKPLALMYALFGKPEQEPYGGGMLFVPKPFWLNGLLEYGKRFRNLFERDVGMPVEHLWAISRALYRLGIETVAADGGRLANWVGYSGTLPVPRQTLLGGALEEAARGELAESYPGLNSSHDLGESVGRFVRLASSSAPRGSFEGTSGMVGPGGKQEQAAGSVRSLAYPYMIHGESNHDLWIVDYLMVPAFFQGLVNELEFSRSKSTTGLPDSDASTRTSIFDARLAEALWALPKIEEVFPENRVQPDAPNVKFYFDGGAQDREIDVPVRFGEVLVAVQTWATEVDPRIDAGEEKAMKRRWQKAKSKLRQTDKLYTDYLLGHPEGRQHMKKEGLRYVLPVVCGHNTEPVASFEPEFWLRRPSVASPEGVEKAIPRILTPPELGGFLATTTEQELKEICQRNDWRLRHD